jgi:hypothetical protein
MDENNIADSLLLQQFTANRPKYFLIPNIDNYCLDRGIKTKNKVFKALLWQKHV